MKIDLSKNGIKYNFDLEKEYHFKAEKWVDRLFLGQEKMSGWVNLPVSLPEEYICQIESTAEHIKGQCSLLIVVGIGGSYLGAKAIYEALNGSKDDCPTIEFAGHNLSASYMNKLLKRLDNESVCMVVISKSGNTVETLLSYSILKERIYAKYGKNEAQKRIYVITDKENGRLRREALENGYKSFYVPEDIGGRYSVLSAVGLFPIAIAGHSIRELLAGARQIAKSNFWREEAIKYATARNILYSQGKLIEIFEYFHESLRFFGEWLIQLFGESEGKNGKGIYPSSRSFTGDLHSMGQFLQEGNQIFFETMIRVKENTIDFIIPQDAVEPFAGKTLETINDCAEKGVIIAHEKGNIPINQIEIDRLDEYNMGSLIFFFEMACAVSAHLMGVDPFDQPGVEAYKNEMKTLVINEVDET